MTDPWRYLPACPCLRCSAHRMMLDLQSSIAPAKLYKPAHGGYPRAYWLTERVQRAERPRFARELWDADPNCNHQIKAAPGGGIKCARCTGWFCY